jgi:hypothetical protein
MIRRYKSTDKDETCYAFTDSSHLGFSIASKALILPLNHNLPPGYVLDITQATMDSFLDRLSQWSGQPVSDWAWFRSGLTKAWFAAAARHPQAFAIPVFPLSSLAPTLDRWRDEAIDDYVSERLRHFVYAPISPPLIQRSYLLLRIARDGHQVPTL